jgi:oligosaccharyltransferase complex subunit alpha (ribophorin I)
LEHQTQSFYGKGSPQILPSLTLQLPPGIRNTYYYDLNGNVSTSKLRIAPSPLIRPANGQHTQNSVFEMRPRYPLMGGWNYSFTLGWDAPLADSVSWDNKAGKYVARIPVITEIPSAVIDDAELTIILPEGAT